MFGEELIKQLFSTRKPSGQAPKTGSGTVGGKTDRNAQMDMDAFAQRVKSLFKSKGAFVAGSVQMLVLTHLQEHFGDRWPQVSKKIHALVQSILNSRLNPSDCYTVFGENTYVIVFSSLSTKAASMKVALIAEEVSRKLFGDNPPKDLLEIGVAKVGENSDFTVETLSSTDLVTQMSSLTGNKRHITEIDVPSSASGDKHNAPTVKSEVPPGKSMETVSESRNWRKIDSSQADANKWIPISPHRSDDRELYEWTSINTSFEPPPDMMFVYRPAWLIKKDMIAAHTCVPARIDNNGIAITGGRAMPSRRANFDNASLDILSLNKVLSDFEELGQEGRQAFVILPVHVQTLESSKYREPYKQILDQISAERRDHIVFELMCANETIPQINIAQAISALKPFCRDLMVRTRLDARNFGEYYALGVHAVGVDFSGMTLPEKDLYAQLNAYSAKARAAHLCTFAHGISTRSLTSGAAAAGLRYVDGRAIATAVEKPAPNRAWTARDVYSSLVDELKEGH